MGNYSPGSSVTSCNGNFFFLSYLLTHVLPRQIIAATGGVRSLEVKDDGAFYKCVESHS